MHNAFFSDSCQCSFDAYVAVEALICTDIVKNESLLRYRKIKKTHEVVHIRAQTLNSAHGLTMMTISSSNYFSDVFL